MLTDGAETKAIANDFIAGFGSPTRRVVNADLSQESAVLEAFAKTAADPELPPVGVVIFAGQQSFDGTDFGDAPARGRDLAWGVAATVRAIIGGWHGSRHDYGWFPVTVWPSTPTSPATRRLPL